MRKLIGPFVVFISLALASTARAQPTQVFAELTGRVEEGQRVRIVRTDGGEIIGDLSTVGPAAIDVEVEGRVERLGSADVREVGVLDSPRNGILIGLGAGLAAGFGTGLVLSQDAGNLSGLAVIMGTAAGGGLGIGIGALIDALHQNYDPVYRSSSTVVRVSPVASPARAYGVMVAVAW